MDDGLLKQIDPAALDALNHAADNIRVHLGSLGIAPEDVERFITDILRQTVHNELPKPTTEN
jgi:hypothetical protein